MKQWLRTTLHVWWLRQQCPTAQLHPSVVVDHASVLGAQVALFANVAVTDSQLGYGTYLQHSVSVNNAMLGPFCSIAPCVVIGLAPHPIDLVSTSPMFYDPAPPLPQTFAADGRQASTIPLTSIGADTWIGHGALIKAGVTIGTGAVIGAGSIVTRDVEPYTIVAGNPARPLRRRFDDAICDALLASQWWLLDEVRLRVLAPHFHSPQALLKALKDSA